MLKENKKYWFILASYILAIFILNINHINQQGVYDNFFRQISENVLSGAGYTCGEFDYKPAFYPLWGYTGILIIDTFFGSSNIFVYLTHYLLCFFAILTFYKIFEIKPKYLHFLWLLPFIALCSVKWPDAVVGCLLVGFLYYLKKYIKNEKLKYILFAGLMLGVIANFRSEYIYLPFGVVLFSFLPKMKPERKRFLYSALLTFVIAIVCMLPWSFRSYLLTGYHRLDASNGWAVMYISLGQLPGNSWNIAPMDKSAFDYAEKLKKHPYTPDGDYYLKQAFKKNISEKPYEFIEKCGLNCLRFFTGGVYTGEFANIITGESGRFDMDRQITAAKGITGKITTIGNLGLAESIPLAIEKLIQFFFVLFFLTIMIYFIIKVFRKHESQKNIALFYSIAGIVFYKILIVSAIQYEYRHVNAVYLLVLGVVLVYFENRPKKSNINSEN